MVSGGKTRACLAFGLAACQRGFTVSFTTAVGLVHQLMEARDKKRLLKPQAQLAAVKLLISDELGYVPLSKRALSSSSRSSVNAMSADRPSSRRISHSRNFHTQIGLVLLRPSGLVLLRR
jgi:hypothetical protein